MITAWMNSHLLTFLVFAPLFWGLVVLLLPERHAPLAKLLGFLGALGIFVIAAFQLLRLALPMPMDSFSSSGPCGSPLRAFQWNTTWPWTA